MRHSSARTSRTLRLVSFVLIALMALAVTPIAALAAESYQYSGKGADAYYDSYDAATDTYTSVYVTGGDFRSFDHWSSGAPERYGSGKLVDVWISSWSSGKSLRNPFDDVYTETHGWLMPTDFTMDKTLSSARATATMPAIVDVYKGVPEGDVWTPTSESQTTMQVDLRWLGVGGVSRDRSSTSYTDPDTGATFRSRYSGTYRNADVSGSIICGGTMLDLPLLQATMFDTRSSETMIDH